MEFSALHKLLVYTDEANIVGENKNTLWKK